MHLLSDPALQRVRSRGAVILMAALFALVFFSLVRSVPTSVSNPVFTSPRQSVTWAMAEAWEETGRPAVTEPRLVSLPAGLGPALTPRDGASQADEILPKDFPLTVVAYAVALQIHPWVALAFNPVAGILLLSAVGGLTYELTKSKWSAGLSVLFLLGTVSFWNNSAAPVVVDTAGAAALVAGTLVLLRSRSAPRWAALAGVLFGVAVSSRYTHIGPALVILGALAVFRRVNLTVVAYAGLGLAMVIGAILAYHNWLYGSPLSTGYGIGDALFADRLRFEGRGLLSFNIGRFTSHARIYLLRPESILLGFLAAVGIYRSRTNGDAKATAFAACVIFVALFAYHGGQGTFGVDEFAVNASFMRYFLPVLAFASVFAGIALSQMRGDRLTFGLAALALAISSSVFTAWTGPGGFESARRQVENQELLRAELVATTPEDALIITRLGSKTIFPERAVLSATLTLDGSRVITDKEILVWEVVPSPAELARSLEALAGTGAPVYVQNDGRTPWLSEDDLAELGQALAIVGLQLSEVGPPELRLLSLHTA